MGQNGPPPGTGGLQMPAVVREMALRLVRDLILAGRTNSREICAQLSERGYTESVSTTRNWMAEVRRDLAEEDLENREARRNIRRAQLEARYSIMMADIDEARALPKTASKYMALAMMYRAAAQCEQLLMNIDSLDTPIKIEHSLTVDVRAMAPEQRRERIAELLKKREQALLTSGEPEAVH